MLSQRPKSDDGDSAGRRSDGLCGERADAGKRRKVALRPRPKKTLPTSGLWASRRILRRSPVLNRVSLPRSGVPTYEPHQPRTTAILFVCLLGLWGCAQGPTATAQAERIKSLETKTARLEADFRAAAEARDQLRLRLSQTEEHDQTVVKERDDLKAQLKLRTGERDQVAAQYDTFRKSIKDLLGQADASVLRFPNGDPVTVTIARPE